MVVNEIQGQRLTAVTEVPLMWFTTLAKCTVSELMMDLTANHIEKRIVVKENLEICPVQNWFIFVFYTDKDSDTHI